MSKGKGKGEKYKRKRQAEERKVDYSFGKMITFNMFGLGFPELIVILIIVVLIFGAGRISEIGGALGKGIKSFKKSVKEPDEIDVTPSKNDKDKGKTAQ